MRCENNSVAAWKSISSENSSSAIEKASDETGKQHRHLAASGRNGVAWRSQNGVK
jgi:hypothetical protein